MNIVQTKSTKLLIVFDYMIVDLRAKKNLPPIVTELFIKTNHFYCFHFAILFFCTKKY